MKYKIRAVHVTGVTQRWRLSFRCGLDKAVTRRRFLGKWQQNLFLEQKGRSPFQEFNSIYTARIVR